MMLGLGSLTILALSSTAAAAPAPAPSTIDVWVRGPGAPVGDSAPRARSETVDLDKLPLADVERVDAQYGGRRVFRGVAVAAVIDRFKPPASMDLALLHFANGMAIPVPFRDADAMRRLDPFIARGMETHRKGPIKVAFFEDIKKKGAAVDVRPIVFGANKVVVSELWHPAVAEKAKATFSPWSHADSLTGIELVAKAPYYHQFDPGTPGVFDVSKGLAVFEQTCQFCHGVRKVGAKLGWDFVEPEPIYKHAKPARNLFYHIRYKSPDAAQKGLMMPAMKHMSEDDAAMLWEWLRAIAIKPQPTYAPPVEAARSPAPAPAR